MSRYASRTEVPVAKSKVDIETIVSRYGASQFVSGWSEGQAVVGFSLNNRQIRFYLPLPDRNATEFWEFKRGNVPHRRSESGATKLWEQACRQRWRALFLVIKAKLEAVESGISEFDDEFLANIVLPDGKLVGEAVKGEIAIAYDTGQVRALLPDLTNR